jgi:acyl-CoA synthetase (AMP-forming)/AMP-acid ligase II
MRSRRSRVEHGRHRLGEIALERAARPVVVRFRDRAGRRRLRARGAHGSDPRSRGDRAVSGADRIPPRSETPGLGERWRCRNCGTACRRASRSIPKCSRAGSDAFGLTILDGYGQTENSLLVANVPGMDVRPGSMGKPTPGHDVDVVDADGNAVRARRGRRHRRARRRRRRSFAATTRTTRRRARRAAATWYLTGDRAQVDDDGYFWFVGRRTT